MHIDFAFMVLKCSKLYIVYAASFCTVYHAIYCTCCVGLYSVSRFIRAWPCLFIVDIPAKKRERIELNGNYA